MLEVKAIHLQTQEQHDAANIVFQEGKRLTKLVDDVYDTVDGEFKMLRKHVKEARDRDRTPFTKRTELINKGIVDWRKRKRIAAEHRAKQEAEVERKRLERVKKKEAERIRKLAEEAGSKSEAKRLETKAKQVEKTVVDTSDIVSKRLAETEDELGQGGVGTRTYWSATCDDIGKLVKACADGTQPVAALQVNQTYLNSMARAMKQNFSIPGCTVHSEEKARSGN